MPRKQLSKTLSCVMLVVIVLFIMQEMTLRKIFTTSISSMTMDPHHFPTDAKTSSQQETAGKNKTILLWTKFFNSHKAWFDFHGPPDRECARKCEITFNRSVLDTADVLVMNSRDLYLFPNDLPGVRSPNQVWIYHNTESPAKTFLDLSPYNNMFNWTSAMSPDSDVPAYYGKTSVGNVDNNALLQNRSIYENKTLGVAWIASNCFSINDREEYVRELQKYIPVDVYGKCGPLKCSSNWKTAQNCLDKYKFYLSFENAHCDGYITEKLWRTYSSGTIPVVRGGGDYNQVAPPGSFINVADYQRPRELAAYLHQVGADRALFNSYMGWHHTHTVHMQDGQYWCDLCHALHTKPQHQVYRNLAAWLNKGACQQSKVPDLLVNFLRIIRHQIDLGIYR